MTNPFLFDVAGFLTSSATAATVTHTGPSPSRIGNAMIAIPEGEPTTVTALISPLGESVMVHATVETTLRGQCAHCLSEIVADYSFDLDEVFVADAESITTQGDVPENEDEDIDVRVIDGNQVDLEQAVIDYQVIELPFSPECTDYGLTCDEDTEELIAGVVDGDEDDKPHITDIRWAGLEKFK